MNTITRPAAQQFPGLAYVLGFQEDGEGSGFWLYNLERDIPGHPIGSTVTALTLNKFLECEARGGTRSKTLRTLRTN